ncbi:CFC_HP_G0008420.mRNA.1.CDS.1 [Saccharomyces cerevisiae]|nr:CFC_HP_G0008420.mRNA.1.CDS.1 [Saccharomyces cerevisiae]CAI6925382.1 CFC_HP_G0008420.mRNA.1.CDS.1 [Saccharomyces cerevisiae]
MSLREPLITKNATATAAENLMWKKRRKRRSCLKKIMDFLVCLSLQRRTSHSTHTIERYRDKLIP